MKKKITAALLVLLLMFSTLSLSSCYIMQMSPDTESGAQNSGGNQNGNNSTINVTGGDNYNVNINAGSQGNVLAASKALLSAVSIECVFERIQYSGWYGQTTSTVTSRGSGVIYKLDKNAGDAYVITNYHVVYDAYSKTQNHISDDITLRLYGQEAEGYEIPATYIGGSMNYDLAVLKVDGSEVLMKSNAMAVSFANSDEVSVLETAIAIGNPEGKGISATVGCVNVDSEYITLSMSDADSSTAFQLRVMRIDAAVNGGNSGGGLFNAYGELIGIVNAKMSSNTVDNIGYAIPSNVVLAVANNIIDYCDGTEKECVYRCIVGINVTAEESYTEYNAETGKIIKKEKVGISVIGTNSPINDKLEVGDVINSITIAGKKYEVFRIHHVVDSMLNARVGDTVVFNVTRGTQTFEVTVNITESLLTPYK